MNCLPLPLPRIRSTPKWRLNALRLGGLAGERRLERVFEVRRKYLFRTSRSTFKSTVHQVWRNDVLDAVLSARMESLQQDRNAGEMKETSIHSDIAGTTEAKDIHDQLILEVLQICGKFK
ncbi:hypothetical protein Y032_0076g1044 [Ancylostoma ceylanicum]|uniref:Uncharacterized protein n=1 Tax=Ancylostoma ceylanicum TaxID=53326 RepID=A0A016TTP3_9BILA|nr:hypothetical protein Y032_0076g1044 [Ancylostoma ceylanicum]